MTKKFDLSLKYRSLARLQLQVCSGNLCRLRLNVPGVGKRTKRTWWCYQCRRGTSYNEVHSGRSPSTVGTHSVHKSNQMEWL